jgi:hypothetical protein
VLAEVPSFAVLTTSNTFLHDPRVSFFIAAALVAIACRRARR